MIHGFLSALQFLTVVPIHIKKLERQDQGDTLVLFPLAGLFIALILIAADGLCAFVHMPQVSANIILVVCLSMITGGLHADGLSDTADGLFSRKGREEMLRIMREPSAGALGALSIVQILLLKIAFLQAIGPALKPAALILMCSLSRWALVYAMVCFPYARSDGKAKDFFLSVKPSVLVQSTLIALACAGIAWQFKGMLVLFVSWLGTKLFNKLIVRKLGGITGDTLGAANEIIEVLCLLSVFLLGAIFNGA